MDGETQVQPLTAVNCTVNEILWAGESMVGLPYDGEPVDQLEHALQCAALARRTLKAQGGAMSEDEVREFRAQPDWRLALALREIDDRANVPGAEVPGLEDYRDELSQIVGAQLSGS
jgi:predicted HD phosphohydrolase